MRNSQSSVHKANRATTKFDDPPYRGNFSAEFESNDGNNEAPQANKSFRVYQLHGFTVWEIVMGVIFGLIFFCVVNGIANLQLLCFITIYTVFVGISCAWGLHVSTVLHFLIALCFLFTLCLVCGFNVVRGYSGNLEKGLPCTTEIPLRRLQENVELVNGGLFLTNETLLTTPLPPAHLYTSTICETARLPALIFGQAIYSAIGIVVLSFLLYHGWMGTQVPYFYHRSLATHWKRLEFEGRCRISFWQLFVGLLGGLSVLTIVHLALLDFLVGVPLLLLFIVGTGCWLVLKPDSKILFPWTQHPINQQASTASLYYHKIDYPSEEHQWEHSAYHQKTIRILSTSLLTISIAAVSCISVRLAGLDTGNSVQYPSGLGLESPIIQAIQQRNQETSNNELLLGTEIPLHNRIIDTPIEQQTYRQANDRQLASSSTNTGIHDAALAAGLMSIISEVVSVLLLIFSMIISAANLLHMEYFHDMLTDKINYCRRKNGRDPQDNENRLEHQRHREDHDRKKGRTDWVEENRRLGHDREKGRTDWVEENRKQAQHLNDTSFVAEQLPQKYNKENSFSRGNNEETSFVAEKLTRKSSRENSLIGEQLSRGNKKEASTSSDRTEWVYIDESQNLCSVGILKSDQFSNENPIYGILENFDASNLVDSEAVEEYDTVEDRCQEIRIPNLIKTVSKLNEFAEAETRERHSILEKFSNCDFIKNLSPRNRSVSIDYHKRYSPYICHSECSSIESPKLPLTFPNLDSNDVTRKVKIDDEHVDALFGEWGTREHVDIDDNKKVDDYQGKIEVKETESINEPFHLEQRKDRDVQDETEVNDENHMTEITEEESSCKNELTGEKDSVSQDGDYNKGSTIGEISLSSDGQLFQFPSSNGIQDNNKTDAEKLINTKFTHGSRMEASGEVRSIWETVGSNNEPLITKNARRRQKAKRKKNRGQEPPIDFDPAETVSENR